MPVTYNALRNIDAHFDSTFAGKCAVRRQDNTVLSADLKATTNFNYFSNSAVVGDFIAFGYPTPWKIATFNIGTARNGTPTIVWEYWNGSAWTTLTGFTDNTTDFSSTGVRTFVVDPEQMSGWIAVVPTGFSATEMAYYVRARITAVGGLTVGGAQQTDKVKFNDHCILVDGFTSGSPSNFTAIKTADTAGGWGVVDQSSSSFVIKAHLHFGSTGFFADTSKIVTLGTNTARVVHTSDAGATQTYGNLASGSPSYRTNQGVAFFHNNTFCYTYPEYKGTLFMYSSSYFSPNSRTIGLSGPATYIDTTLDINNCYQSNTKTFIRTNIKGSSNYMFSNTSSAFSDLQISVNTMALDPGYFPTMYGSKFLQPTAWIQMYQSSGVKQVYCKNIGSTWYDFTLVNPNNSTANQNCRQQLVDAVKYDLNVTDTSSVAQQNAVVYIEDATIAHNFVASGATVNAVVDSSAWGGTTVTSTNGALHTIGDNIKIDDEIMTITNIVTNTLTVTRAVGGTYIAQHLVGAVIQEAIPSQTTNVSGNIPQNILIYRQNIDFGTSTPAPSNTGNNITENKNPYNVKVRKYPYLVYSQSKTLTKDTTDSVQLPVNSIITVTNPVTVAAYTGISINHSTQTITISSNHSIEEIYDYCYYNLCLSASITYEEFFTSTDGINFTSAYDLTLNGGSITGTGTINLGTKTFTRAGSETTTLPITYNSGAAVFGNINVSGFVANSRVRVNNTTDNIELYNAVVAGTSVTIPVTWTANKALELRVTYVNGTTAKEIFKQTNTLTSSLASFTVAQVDDPVYIANAIDGSTVTYFSTDYPNLEVDITSSSCDGFLADGTPYFQIQKMYAWFQYATHSSQGIVYYFGGLTAQDIVNYRIDPNIVDLSLDNISGVNIAFVGGYLARTDGSSYIYSLTANSIIPIYDRAYVAGGISGKTIFNTKTRDISVIL